MSTTAKIDSISRGIRGGSAALPLLLDARRAPRRVGPPGAFPAGRADRPSSKSPSTHFTAPHENGPRPTPRDRIRRELLGRGRGRCAGF
jgi:hypothetical protein